MALPPTKLGLPTCHLVVADLRRPKSRTGAWPTLPLCSNTRLLQLLQLLHLLQLLQQLRLVVHAWETLAVLLARR